MNKLKRNENIITCKVKLANMNHLKHVPDKNALKSTLSIAVLKTVKELACLISAGKEFQTFTAR